MTPVERRLLRHLVLAVMLKLLVLTALWWVFVRDARVSVDVDQVGQQIGGAAAPQGASK
ncbi:MAG TPA: hypothetical protein VEQ09_08790 [Aquabacterium sp.]|nr:hypothetical protein [Aquabacterium sp.]